MWQPPLTPFRVTRNNRRIYEVKLRYTLDTGIEIQPLAPGIVPLFYEMEACQRAGYQYFNDWQELSTIDKAYVVAQFYVSRLIQSHQSDAEISEMERKKKTKG